MEVFSDEAKELVKKSYAKFDSRNVGSHIDGPPFVALLINDKPGLQVVAGEGKWMDAPVTCRTAEGNYHVPVIPGSVIVNTGGTSCPERRPLLSYLAPREYNADPRG